MGSQILCKRCKGIGFKAKCKLATGSREFCGACKGKGATKIDGSVLDATPEVPGTFQKINVLRKRAESEAPLFNPSDAQEDLT